MSENNEKAFDLGVVLSVATGRLFVEMDYLYDFFNYLTGDIIFIHQVPRLMKLVQPYVLGRFPQLSGVGLEVAINDFDEAKAYVESIKPVFGETLSISPLPEGLWTHMDPDEDPFEEVPERTSGSRKM